MIVRVTADKIIIMEAAWEWSGHVPARRGQIFAKTPLRTSASRMAELLAMNWSKRLSRYPWCPRCQVTQEPEMMHQAICHGCAERVLGIGH